MRFRSLILAFALLFSSSVVASAQPVLVNNQSGVSFTASTDHNTTVVVNGVTVNVVTGYSLTVYAGTTGGALAFTFGLGKPTPVANVITVKPLSVTANPFGTLSQGSYVATVQADGPGGSGVSLPSDPFGRVLPGVAPGKPTIIPQ